MVRTFIGGIAAGVILFVAGFVFWATPLAELAYSDVDHARNAALQAALAQNLGEGGTGTYIVPAHRTAEGAMLYAQGPIATVHFNTTGYSPDDMGMMVPGLIFAIVSGLLIAFGLAAVGGGGRSFASLARLVVLFSIGVTVWTILAQPIFNHFGWAHWIYAFIAETTSLILAGLAVARWFMPRYERAADAAPAAPGPSATTM